MSTDRLADILLVAFALEALLLAAGSRRSERPRLVGLLPTLLSGVFLAVALKATTAGLDWRIVGAALAAAGGAHAVDLRMRLRRR